MRNIYWGIVISLLFSFSGNAQLVLPAALQEPIEQAMGKNKEISNKQIDLEITRRERKSVLSKYIPRVEANAAYSYFDNDLTVDLPGVQLPVIDYELFDDKTKFKNHGNIFHGSIMAKSVLFSGLQINNGAKALAEKVRGDELMIETDKDELLIDVVHSFDQLRYIRASELLISDSDKRLEKEEKRINKAIENGLAIPFDRDKIKLARIKLESKRTELEESKKLLFQKLNYLVGMGHQEIEQISYELDPFVLEEELNVENKQELEALESYKKAAKYLIKKEKGSYLPQVAAFGGVSYSSLFNGSASIHSKKLPPNLNNKRLGLNELTVAPNWMIGVGLKWEIFGGTERKQKIKQAELNLDKLKNKTEDSRDKLNLLLQQKQAAYTTQWKQMDLADQQKVIAENSLTQARKQYQQGLISINQRLESENDFVKAGQKKTRALIDQREAALEAFAVTGKLTEKIQYQ